MNTDVHSSPESPCGAFTFPFKFRFRNNVIASLIHANPLCSLWNISKSSCSNSRLICVMFASFDDNKVRNELGGNNANCFVWKKAIA